MSVRSNILYSELNCKSDTDDENNEIDDNNCHQKFDNNSFSDKSISINMINNSTCNNLTTNSDNNINCIDHKDYPECTWYTELVTNFTTFPDITVPEFVTTYAESLKSQTYSDSSLYTIASGEIDPNKKFVYLVHGRNGHPTDLDYISIYLKETTDHNIILTYIPNSKECSIEAGADILKSIIFDTYGEINKEHNGDNILIISHSKGGVISMYLNEFLIDNKISKIMTIASPINGTAIASYAGDFYTRTELSFDSECLKMINEMAKLNNVTSYYHVAVEKDHVIIPSVTSAIPDGHKWNQCSIIKNVCHISVLYSNGLMEILNTWVD